MYKKLHTKATRQAIFALIGLAFGVSAAAQTTTFTASSGNWNTSGNWSNGVPTASVDAVIQAGSVCSLDVSGAACKSLTISGGSSNTGFVISGSNTLSVTNAITISAPSSNSVTNTLSVGAGTVSCASLTQANTGASSRICSLTVSTGTL